MFAVSSVTLTNNILRETQALAELTHDVYVNLLRCKSVPLVFNFSFVIFMSGYTDSN